MKFSCCVEMIYTDLPFIDRFYKAKEDGFKYVEFWNWDNKDIPAIKKVLEETGLKIAAFQGNSGGRMVDAREHDAYMCGVQQGIEVAKEIGALNMFLMSDILQEDRSVKPLDIHLTDEEKEENSIIILRQIASLLEGANLVAVIEPLNTTVDHHGYSLYSTKDGVRLLDQVKSPNIKLLYDAYHMQIMEGDIINNINRYHNYFGHFHMADVPGRHEPGTGELNYFNILKALQETGYDRVIGFELEPLLGGSSEVMTRLLSEYSNL